MGNKQSCCSFGGSKPRRKEEAYKPSNAPQSTVNHRPEDIHVTLSTNNHSTPSLSPIPHISEIREDLLEGIGKYFMTAPTCMPFNLRN